MKLKIALIGAAGVMALTTAGFAASAWAGDKADGDKKVETRVMVIGGPGHDGPEGDCGPMGDHMMMMGGGHHMEMHRMHDGKDGGKDGGPGKHMEMRMAGPMLGHLDANKDGTITRDEFAAMHNQMFDKLDANKDGKLSGEELEHGPGGDHGPDGHAGPGGPHGPGDVRIMCFRHGGPDGPGGHDGDGPEDLDANKDGKVSFEEFAAPLREAFAAMDADKSGYLEKGEEPKGRHVEIHRIERHEDDGKGKN